MYCGAHCLVYVHRRHGKRVSLTRAARIAGTNRNGTRVGGILLALDLLDYRAALKERLTWARLRAYVRRGNDVFVSWWSDLDAGDKRPVAVPADGHWSVVTGITRDTITLFDPDVPHPRELPRVFFESRWWDYEIDPDDGTHRHLLRAAVIARPRPQKVSKSARPRRAIKPTS